MGFLTDILWSVSSHWCFLLGSDMEKRFCFITICRFHAFLLWWIFLMLQCSEAKWFDHGLVSQGMLIGLIVWFFFYRWIWKIWLTGKKSKCSRSSWRIIIRPHFLPKSKAPCCQPYCFLFQEIFVVQSTSHFQLQTAFHVVMMKARLYLYFEGSFIRRG